MENKTRLIAPTLMLFAGAIASIIMLIKNYDFYTMLWTLLIVLIVFYVIGDVVRYIYASVRPCILPQSPDLENILAKMNQQEDDEEEDEVVEVETDFAAEEATETDAYQSEDAQDVEAAEEDAAFEGASDEENDEYTDENLDEI